MAVAYLDSYEQAARQSKTGRAVSRPFTIPTYRKARGQTELTRVEVIKPLQGEPYLVYAGTNIKVYKEKVTPQMVDAIRDWRPY